MQQWKTSVLVNNVFMINCSTNGWHMHASRFRWVGSSKSPICSLYICFKQQKKMKQDHYHVSKEAKMGSFIKKLPQEKNIDIDS